MRTGRLRIAAMVGMVVVASSAEARRVVKVSPTCADKAARVVVDYDGIKDICVATIPVACAPGFSIVIDRKGEADRCVAGERGEREPSCPSGYHRRVKPGPDECVMTAQPVCAHGFELQVRPGEDACVY
jgi:hypothetical protein